MPSKRINLFLTSFSFFIITNTCFSQTRFGIIGGPQLTTAQYSVRGEKQSASYKTGFNIGGIFKIPFENNLYFTPSAFYSLKGYKVNLTSPAYPPDLLAIDNNTTIHTFELAFLLQYDFGKGPGHVFIQGGPSLDFQLVGKEKFNRSNNEYVEQDMRYAFDAYGHYGANAIIKLGYETKSGFSVCGQYTYGLGNLNNADEGPKIQHRIIGLTIGKYFATFKP